MNDIFELYKLAKVQKQQEELTSKLVDCLEALVENLQKEIEEFKK